jgi:hypothetical protein
LLHGFGDLPRNAAADSADVNLGYHDAAGAFIAVLALVLYRPGLVGGKQLAGGFNKTEVVIGQPPANRLVIYSYPNKAAWDKLLAGHLKDVIDDGSKYATFRIFGVEGVEQK